MEKAFILIFLILGFSNTQFDQYTSGYDSEYSQYYPAQDKTEDSSEKGEVTPACAGAISNANRAFNQLTKDIRTSAPQWSVFTDFDAVDEVSYFIQSQCNPEDLDLVNKGEVGLDEAQDKACEEFLTLVLGILEQNSTSSFRGGFEGGIVISKQGLELGPKLGDNCQLELVSKKVNDTEIEDKVSEDLLLNHSDDNNNVVVQDNNSQNQINSSIQIQLLSLKSNYTGENRDLQGSETDSQEGFLNQDREVNQHTEKDDKEYEKKKYSRKSSHDHWENHGIGGFIMSLV